MKKPISYPNFLKAIHDLGIDVPVLNVEEAEDGSLTFYLYGGAVKHWPPDALIVAPEPAGEGPAFQEPSRRRVSVQRGDPQLKARHKRHNSEMKEES